VSAYFQACFKCLRCLTLSLSPVLAHVADLKTASLTAQACTILLYKCVLVHCTVVRDTLENRGVLGQLRARIRAEVFSALNDPTDSRPEVSRENFLINELIREYLEFNHYKYASSVLTAGLYINNHVSF